MRPLRKIALTLGTLALLPALVYLAGRVHSIGEDEALIEAIYDRQLETLLYSVNQYAWDVTNAWAGRLDGLLAADPPADAAAAFLAGTPTVKAVVLADTMQGGAEQVAWFEATQTTRRRVGRLRLDPATVAELLAHQRQGYRKLAPLVYGEAGAPTVALFFVAGPVARPRLAGLVLDSRAFVEEVIGPRLQEVAQEGFVLGVFRKGAAEPLYSTAALGLAEARRQRRLWLFPDYHLGIRLQGRSLEDILSARLYRDLGLIGLVALVLLAGTGLVYRNVRREVALAQLKSDFVSNVSHELRTPLALIRMYAETLELGRVPAERRLAYYRIIGQEAERLTHLINNILNFSRIEAGRKQYRLAPLDLNAVVEEVLARYAFTLHEQGFTVERRLEAALPLVQGDAEAVTEALFNLIDNALKYSGDARYLGVRTGVAAGSVFVEVADRGIGIPPEEQQAIFEQFYRVPTGLVHDTKGTGLGLALVRHIMEAHHGTVSVASRPGAGSRFRLVFPRAEAPAPASVSHPHPQPV